MSSRMNTQSRQQSSRQHEYLTEIAQTDKRIRNFLEAVDYIHRLQNSATNAASDRERQEYTRKLESIIQETNKLAGQIRNEIKQIDRVAASSTPIDKQMLTSQKQNLAKKFIDGLTKYQTIQQQYQRAQQERVKRQYLIVNPNATQEELEAVADDQHAGPVFAQQLLSSQRYGAVRNQLDSVQQRHDEIVKLAQSIEQLHQLFMDMQTMIEAQDAYVMQVSNHINETAASTRKAADEMRVAVKHKKTSIKRKRLMILCCVILLLVIFSLLLFLPSSPLYIFTLIDKSKGTSSSNTSSNTNGNSNTSK